MSDPITTINDRLDAIKDQLDNLAQPTSAAAGSPPAAATAGAQQQTIEHDTPSTPPAAPTIDLAALEAFRESLQRFTPDDLRKLSEPMRTPWSGEHSAGLEAPTLPNAELANPASLTSGLADQLTEALDRLDRLDGLTMPGTAAPTSSPSASVTSKETHTVERVERIIEQQAEEQRQTWARIGELAEQVEIERPGFALPTLPEGVASREQDTPIPFAAGEGLHWPKISEHEEDYALKPPAWTQQLPAAEMGFDRPGGGAALHEDMTRDMFRKLTPEQIASVDDRNAFGLPRMPSGTEGGSPSHPPDGRDLSPLQDLFGGLVGFGGHAPGDYEQDYHEAQMLGGEGGAGDVLGLLQEMMSVMKDVKQTVEELKNQRGGEGGGSRHEASADGPLQRKPFSMDIPDLEGEETFPQASPSVNVSTVSNTGGAGGFGYGSKHAAPGSVIGGGTGKPRPGTGRSSFFEPGQRGK